MIIPTLLIYIERPSGYDLHGQPVLAPKRAAKVAPVKVKFTDQHTTVRTDSSGTHGAALETVADVVLLAKPNVDIQPGDIVTVVGRRVRVQAIHPRFEVTGRHDHNQIDCEAWK